MLRAYHAVGSGLSAFLSCFLCQNKTVLIQNVENRSIKHFYSGFNKEDLEITLICQKLGVIDFYLVCGQHCFLLYLGMKIYFVTMIWDCNVNHFIPNTSFIMNSPCISPSYIFLHSLVIKMVPYTHFC